MRSIDTPVHRRCTPEGPNHRSCGCGDARKDVVDCQAGAAGQLSKYLGHANQPRLGDVLVGDGIGDAGHVNKNPISPNPFSTRSFFNLPEQFSE